jgi:hypothetical protein
MDPAGYLAQGSTGGATGSGAGADAVGSGSGGGVAQGIDLMTGSDSGPQPLALRAWTATMTFRHAVWTVMVTRRTEGAKVLVRHSLQEEEPG